MRVRIEVSCHGNGLAVYVEAVGVMQVGQVVEEIAHAAAHVKYHFRGGGRKHIRHVPAYFMRGEELSHLGFLLRFGVLVVIGKIGLLEVVQSSDTRIAVVYTLRRNHILTGVDGKENLLVDLCTLALWYLLWYDGIHGCND